MKKKKTKGFTLIELLAIIVILAIIAVITVPIILDVIDNAKKGSIQDSAYGYKDAINKYYVSELYENLGFNLDGSYIITDKGRLSNDTGVHEIPFTGTTPTGGYLTYENNILTSGCIAMDEYKATIEDGEVTTVEKGECTSSVVSNFGGQVITDIPANGHTGVKAIVYLDPTDLTTECNAEIDSQNVNADGSKTGIKIGCMKWYAFEEDDDTYTMILDHNTSGALPWITKKDYEQSGSQTTTPTDVGIEYLNGLPAGTWYSNTYGVNNRGPITLLGQLKADTSNWDAVETLTENDLYTAEWTGSDDYYYSGNQKYTINYNTYKARLISAEEINRITGKEVYTVSDIKFGRLDSDCSSSGSCSVGTNKYGWLFDYLNYNESCTQYGCNNESGEEMLGYWTISADASGATNAFLVDFMGMLGSYIALSDNSLLGVRPVITVSKANLS